MPTAAQLVADSIRRQIVTGELQDGESLPPEAALIETYGVSRPTFREALRILQSESLISIRRGSRGGARVNAPMIDPIARHAGYVLQHQATTLEDVYEARRILEPPAAAMLATTPKATKKALREALAVEQEAAALDPKTYARASADFHEAVMRLAGNNTLALFAGILHGIIDRHSETVYRDEKDIPGRRSRSDAAHAKLVELVEAGDVAGAEAHWREHLDEIGVRMSKTPALKRQVDLFS
ncbi:MAG: FCD domain-containing protein [Actinomycetota bacterium]|nr:FCD domain-containing protein [Actinomycetota bacterium]